MRRAALLLAVSLGVASATVACGEDRGEIEATEPPLDASPPIRTTPDDAAPEAKAPDTTAPGAVTDLAARAVTHTSVEVTFTAPGDDGTAGRASSFEIRRSEAPITDATSFEAATLVAGAPAPLPSGQAMRLVLDGLAPETTIHVALRARDAAGNVSAISNVASATTKARAAFLVTEIAPVNGDAEGGDFVELVATKAGFAKDIEIRHAAASAVLHRLGALDVALGDRIVVHARGLPGPSGFVQEDAARDVSASKDAFASPTAYDVYSATTGLVGTSTVISVVDGAVVLDAVAYSSRVADASAAAMTAFAQAFTDGAWTFTTPPVDGPDDCATLLQVVNANGSASTAPACGGYPGFLAAGSSIQRNGVVDTNTRGDFAVAPQTRGAANAPFCDPEGALLELTEVSPAPVNLLELTATRAGSLRGFSVRRNPTLAAPTGSEVLAGGSTSPMPPICVAQGDVVVIHLAMQGGTGSESDAKDQLPTAQNAGNYDQAWDVATTTASSSLSFATSSVVALRDPTGTYVEAAVFTSGTTAASAAFNASLQYVQGLGLWLPADCNGTPCDNTTTPTGRDLAASWNGVGATAGDASCRRATGAGKVAASWSVGPSSFGAAN
jgi:hypothetical protein